MTDRPGDEMGRTPRTSREEPADGPGEMWTVSDRVRTHDDAVLRGDVSGVPADLVPLAALIAALRGRVASEPAPPMGEPLRAQVAAPNVVALRAARSARRALVVAAAVLAVVALIGIGAAQNRLPDELQDAVASTAEVLGVDVPHSSERGEDGSDAGLEHGRDDAAPGASTAGRATGHPRTPGDAQADPDAASEQATPATPPAPQDDGSEEVDKAKPVPPSAPASGSETPALEGDTRGDQVDDAPSAGDQGGDEPGDDELGDDDQSSSRAEQRVGQGPDEASSRPAKDR